MVTLISNVASSSYTKVIQLHVDGAEVKGPITIRPGDSLSVMLEFPKVEVPLYVKRAWEEPAPEPSPRQAADTRLAEQMLAWYFPNLATTEIGMVGHFKSDHPIWKEKPTEASLAWMATLDELTALPVGAQVYDKDNRVWSKAQSDRGGRMSWTSHGIGYYTTNGLRELFGPVTLTEKT